MTAISLLFTLSCIGISETVYLIRARVAADQPYCPIGGGCVKVLESKYSTLFFVHNDVMGLLCYIAIASVSALLVIGVPPAPLWSLVLKILVGAGSAASFFFSYLQWRVIRAWCFWCLMSAITLWLMGIVLLSSSL